MKNRLSMLLAFAALLFAPPLAHAAEADGSLLFTLTATGNSAADTFAAREPTRPRIAEIRAVGTFGGTTITLQTLAAGSSTWVTDPDVSITAASVTYVYIVPGDSVRLVLTGGSSISLTVRIR